MLSAATSERRMYWLQQLQKARRDFAATNRNSLNAQVGHAHKKILDGTVLASVSYGTTGDLIVIRGGRGPNQA